MAARQVVIAGLVVGVLALGAVALLRTRQSPSVLPAASPASAAHPLGPQQLERSIAQMRERVQASPDDATAWAMLAHAYDMLGRYNDARSAYQRLVELRPQDAQVLADAADSLAAASGGRLQGEAMTLVQRALALDPKNLKALSLAGTEAFDRQDPAQAIAYWQRARALVTDASLASEIDVNLAAARALRDRIAADASARTASAPVSSNASVSGTVVLSSRLADKVSASDTVFVFARPADGSRMPVALMRRRAGDLPFEFTLDDSMAMVPRSRLSSQPQVIVGARISRRGDAMPQAGDLQSVAAPVSVGARGLQIEINEVVQ
jgi:cytochrome c-type biogenesis protein CcmH